MPDRRNGRSLRRGDAPRVSKRSRFSSVGEIDLTQFAACLRAGGWTNLCCKCKGSTEGGDDDLCSNVIILTTGRHAVMECSYGRAFVRNEGVTFAN